MNSLNLLGFGTARADLPAIAALRKSLPAWAPGTATLDEMEALWREAKAKGL